MAETSGPWDGSEGFTEEEWRLLFGSSTLDGVLREDGAGTPDGLTPSFSNSNREITFSPGKARIRGHLYQSDSNIVIDVPVPSGSNERIDYVVLRYDPSEEEPDDRIKMVLVEGNEGSDPSAPSLTQEFDGVWEWPRIRIGPFGSGAISGAPARFMGTAIQPVTWKNVGDPNDYIPGLSTVHDAIVVNDDGEIWRYDANDGKYEKVGAPKTGQISSANGWKASPETPRWRLASDGLVTLSGAMERTGDTFDLPRLGGDSVLISGSLPSAVRPPFFKRFPSIAQVHINDTFRYVAVMIEIESSTGRLSIVDASADDATPREMRPGRKVTIDGLSWWVN